MIRAMLLPSSWCGQVSRTLSWALWIFDGDVARKPDSVHHGIRRIHCEHAFYSEYDASDLRRCGRLNCCRFQFGRGCRSGGSDENGRWIAMWEFLMGFLFARATGTHRYVRILLFLILAGSVIAGVIYVGVVINALNERNHNSHAPAHSTP